MEKKARNTKPVAEVLGAPAVVPGPEKPDTFPIVGMGASAGGLEALVGFFTHMPVNSGMAFVVIQHLDPNQKGMLAELLQHHTRMPVQRVTNRMAVKPNNVYVIPPNKSMSILHGTLHLFKLLKIRGLRLPIDYFLRSLALDCENKSIGIILSGMGSDGSLGIQAIKEKGGMVLVQDPNTARFQGMPLSAINAVHADIVAPVIVLPKKLIALTKQHHRILLESKPEKDSESLEKIITLLRSQTGNDFSQYKNTTLYRRIERRMGIHQISRMPGYVRYLRDNPEEIEILFRELLIGVTSFFRDAALWDYLKQKIVPRLLDQTPENHVLRAWVPGCSTGEEVYSLAIVFKEALEGLQGKKNVSLQIFATDLDAPAIETARKGIYPSNIVTDVSPQRLDRFFTNLGNHYRVNMEIREMVVFAPQNLLKDPPFTKLDILSCRNLLIYIGQETQSWLFTMFHYSLNPGGLLVLGNSETNAQRDDLFLPVDSRLKVYKSTGSIEKEEIFNFQDSFTRNNKFDPILLPKVHNNIQTLTEQLLLQQFSPASVLATSQGDILYITGSTGKYLEPAAGKANFNLFAMAREGLHKELPVAFRSVMEGSDRIELHNIKIGSKGMVPHTADVTIQRIEKPLPLKGKILVLFKEVPTLEKTKPTRGKTRASEPSAMELENQLLKEELQKTREEMQISQEELYSTREEFQTTNEELQSTNEEITVSTEEMQSLNEELYTVNAELQNKMEEAIRAKNDINNLFNSLEVASLLLDKNLDIRQFTPSATTIFRLRDKDAGRQLTDITSDLKYPDLHQDARTVLHSLVPIQKVVETRDERWFSVKIMPYRTLEDKIDGLVLTLVDITISKRAEQYLKNSQMTLRALIHEVSAVVLGLSNEGQIIEYNHEAEKLFGYDRQDVIGRNYVDIFIPRASRETVQLELKNLLGGEFPNLYKNYVRTANGEELTVEWSAFKLFDDTGKFAGVITLGTNITKPNKI